MWGLGSVVRVGFCHPPQEPSLTSPPSPRPPRCSVLFAFQGIYTTATEHEVFAANWLLAYFQAYALGLVIVFAVNWVVFPYSAERELRQLLVSSLQNVAVLAHLLCKSYLRDIQDDEVEVRDLLVKTIRSDYLSLAGHLEDTSYEVIWSRWAYADLQQIIGFVKGLQQALITSSSALELIETLDPEGVNLEKHLFARSEAATSFGTYRHGLDLVIADLIDEILGKGAHNHCPPAGGGTQGPDASAETDLEKQGPAKLGRTPTKQSTLQQIATVRERLQREVLRSELRHEHIRHTRNKSTSSHNTPRPGVSRETTPPGRRPSNRHSLSVEPPTWVPSPAAVATAAEAALPAVEFLQRAWDAFARTQNDALVRLIKDGALQVEDVLEIEAGMPSMRDMYEERLPKSWTSSLISSTPLRKMRSARSAASGMSRQGFIDEDDVGDGAPDTSEATANSAALTKNYSLAFGFQQLSEELMGLDKLLKARKQARLRFHLFGTLCRHAESLAWWRKKDGMTLQQALASLRRVDYHPPKKPWITYLIKAEKWLRQDHSLYAAKVAVGAAVYTTLLLAPGTKERLFLRFGEVSALITISVAIQPTMGGTFATWILQLSGTGVGALYGLVVLEIFHNVGGYTFNPYGLTAAVWLWSIPHSYLFYKFPKYYTGSLLMMTGTAGIITLEWLYNDFPPMEEAYDSPPLRFGGTILSLVLSMCISAILQLFVFRSPARHKLRQALAAVTFALSSYNLLLQNYINVVAPPDEAPQPPEEALAKIRRELEKREAKIQTSILALSPMFEFAKVEPSFAMPFKGPVLQKIMRSQQIMLDRLREGRTAVAQGFDFRIHHDFASVLWPYRLHSQRLGRTLFYLGANSLVSKSPLPRDVPSSKPTWASFEHDALVLSRRLSQLPRGEEELKRPAFLRYWFYLVSLGAVATELEELEKHLAELFGSPEVTNVSGVPPHRSSRLPRPEADPRLSPRSAAVHSITRLLMLEAALRDRRALFVVTSEHVG